VNFAGTTDQTRRAFKKGGKSRGKKRKEVHKLQRDNSAVGGLKTVAPAREPKKDQRGGEGRTQEEEKKKKVREQCNLNATRQNESG